MTTTQKMVLVWMDARNAGAIRFGGHWLFLDDIRNDSELADSVVASW